MAVTEKQWTVDEIKALLKRNDRAVERGILAIYGLQTEDEQYNKETRMHNGVGFSSFDSKILSSFAQIIQSKRPLTRKQMEVARNRILKYSKQLLMIVKEKQAVGA